MTGQILRTGTYTIRNAGTNNFLTVQGPIKAAVLVGSSDGRADNAAWVIEKLSGHNDKFNIRSFMQNSYATVNLVPNKNASLTCGWEAFPWSITPIEHANSTYVISPHSNDSLYWSLEDSANDSQAILTNDRTKTVHWCLDRVSA